MKDIEIIVLLMFIAQSLYTPFLMRQIMTLEKIIISMILAEWKKQTKMTEIFIKE